jgi:hypothetical protein
VMGAADAMKERRRSLQVLLANPMLLLHRSNSQVCGSGDRQSMWPAKQRCS